MQAQSLHKHNYSSQAIPIMTALPFPVTPRKALFLAITLTLPGTLCAQTGDDAATLDTIRVSAEQIARQALGASTLLADDIQRQPPRGDIAELLRTLPGVNLTGNSTSGQRGNNRQIDIRGMGPENTLILVDGKPVSSRQSVRYGWRGERDSRGDTSWVAPEQIERIDVLRGPAAARYGNGAAGGVVNIITRAPGDAFTGSLNLYAQQPEHSVDGNSRRAQVQMSGPLGERVSFRLSGSASRVDADDFEINKAHASKRTGSNAGSFPAGREGVRGRNFNTELRWQVNDDHRIDLGAGFSRQGNIYTGDTQNTNRNPEVLKWIGGETNRLYRQTYDLSHRGRYGEATTSLTWLALEDTRNTRLLEGMAGGTEGIFNPNGGFGSIDFTSLNAHTELSHTLTGARVDQVLTAGLDLVNTRLDDRSSALKARNPQPNVPPPPGDWQGKIDARLISAFIEDNLYLGERWMLTPALRFDHHDKTGSTLSPALNTAFNLTSAWTAKLGLARAYKAPNLYQANPGYALYSAGIGCWGGGGACYLMGNPDLKAETSFNTEFGVEYAQGRTQATLTWFRNDYRNKVEAGREVIATHAGRNVFQWDNTPKAVIQGIEGNLRLALGTQVEWSNNFTWMLESKNKETGDYLSVIPEYTINSLMDWRASERVSLLLKATFYGEQRPQRFDYQGKPVTGSAAERMPGYALVGISGRYQFNDAVSLVAGIDNLLDKRIFRRGNAAGVNIGTPNEIQGAGAYTYNEPGRALFVSVNLGF